MSKTFMVYNRYHGNGVDSWRFTCCKFEISIQGWADNINFCPSCGSKIDIKIDENTVDAHRKLKNKVYTNNWDNPYFLTYIESIDHKGEWTSDKYNRFSFRQTYRQKEQYSKNVNSLANALYIANLIKKEIDSGKPRLIMFTHKYRIVIEKTNRNENIFWRKIIFEGTINKNI